MGQTSQLFSSMWDNTVACHGRRGFVWQAGTVRGRGCGRRPWRLGHLPASTARLIGDLPICRPGCAASLCTARVCEEIIILAAGRHEMAIRVAGNAGTGLVLGVQDVGIGTDAAEQHSVRQSDNHGVRVCHCRAGCQPDQSNTCSYQQLVPMFWR